MDQTPETMPEIKKVADETSAKGSIGPLIGSIIIIIVLVIGAIYFWGDMLNKKDLNKQQTASSTITIIENTDNTTTTSKQIPTDMVAPEGPSAD